MISDKLRRFPENDPVQTNYSNQPVRDRLAQQTADFLAAGGVIECVDHTSNHSFNQPIKRERKAQVDYMRRHNKIIPCD